MSMNNRYAVQRKSFVVIVLGITCKQRKKDSKHCAA